MKHRDCNSYDIAKCIAIIAMVIDHIGMFFYPEQVTFRLIGRIAFPIFLFLIGYSQKFINKRDIILLMIVMAALDCWLCVESTFFTVSLSTILPVIVISRWICGYMQNWFRTNLIKSFLLLAMYNLVFGLFFMFGTFGCLFIICGDLRRNNINNWHSHAFFALTIAMYVYIQSPNYSPIQVATLSVLMLGLTGCMYLFRLETINIKNILIKKSIMLCARYSLYVYCLHYQLFKLLSM